TLHATYISTQSADGSRRRHGRNCEHRGKRTDVRQSRPAAARRDQHEGQSGERNGFSPPATAVGDMPMFCPSFNNPPRRIQNGGWARRVTQSDFQIAEEIAGVNMRLTRGAIRELHWHQAAEWAYVSRGSVRVTTIDTEGRANVEDVGEGGLWYFPSGL